LFQQTEHAGCGGTAAVADIGELFDFPHSQVAFAAVAALAGLIQLVFDTVGLARTHEFLQRRFYELVAEIAENLSPTEADAARWESALNRLYAEEKPPMRALDAVSYNSALESLGMSQQGRIPIKWHQSALRQILPFNGSSF